MAFQPKPIPKEGNMRKLIIVATLLFFTASTPLMAWTPKHRKGHGTKAAKPETPHNPNKPKITGVTNFKKAPK